MLGSWAPLGLIFVSDVGAGGGPAAASLTGTPAVPAPRVKTTALSSLSRLGLVAEEQFIADIRACLLHGSHPYVYSRANITRS